MPNESSKSKKQNYQDPKLVDRWANFLNLVRPGVTPEQARQKIRELLREADPASYPAAPRADTKGIQ